METKIAATPRRPLSAYNLFIRDEVNRLLSRYYHKGLSGKPDLTNLSRLMSRKWKHLPEPQRAFYDTRAAQEQLEYARQLVQWRDGALNKSVLGDGMPVCDNATGGAKNCRMGRYTSMRDSKPRGSLYKDDDHQQEDNKWSRHSPVAAPSHSMAAPSQACKTPPNPCGLDKAYTRRERRRLTWLAKELGPDRVKFLKKMFDS